MKRNIRNKYPFVSFILAVRNESIYIKKCIESLLHQDYPYNRFEIIISDGMSEDRTIATIQSIKKFGIKIKILNNPHKIVACGLNIAIQNSRGQILIRIDGHSFVAPDYIKECVSGILRSGADNVGGRMIAVGQNKTGKSIACATSSPFGIGDARFHFSNSEEWVDTVYMGAWPRKIFNRIGLFDEELKRNQDDEFNYRIRKFGGKILLTPNIKSQYFNRNSFSSLWSQYYEYGFWKVRVFQKHPKQMRWRQFVPPLFVACLIGTGILLFFSEIGLPFFILIVGFYLTANLTASLLEASRNGWRHLPLLPAAFAVMHAGYGLGFLAGLVRFALRWGDKTGKVPGFKDSID